MQTCFRKYPEVYGSELDSDADDEDDLPTESAPAYADSTSTSTSLHSQSESKAAHSDSTPARSPKSSAPQKSTSNDESAPAKPNLNSTSETASADKGKLSSEHSSKPPTSSERPGLGLVPDNYKPKTQEPVSESEELVPKGAHDAGDEGTGSLKRK